MAVHELEQADAASRRSERAGVRRRLETQKVSYVTLRAACRQTFVFATAVALLCSLYTGPCFLLLPSSSYEKTPR